MKMNDTRPLTASERCARSLLAAWNRGDLATLQTRLEMAPPADPGAPSSEIERIELVQEIAATIRLWLQGIRRKSTTDVEASVRLLRHLARCEDAEDLPEATPTREAARSEMLVFARN
jgi:hypothetical protein